MIKRAFLGVTITMLLASSAAVAQLERQYDAHVHGTASGNLSLDGGDMRVELEIPGINLVGFEHAPTSDEQQATLDATIASLRAADWLASDPRGACEIASVSTHAHGFDDDDDHDHDHEDHNHDNHAHHDHKHDEHDHADQDHHGSDQGHAEFHVVVMLECQAPARLGWVDLGLFDAYPGNGEMVIDVLTDSVATQARLMPGSERITLE